MIKSGNCNPLRYDGSAVLRSICHQQNTLFHKIIKSNIPCYLLLRFTKFSTLFNLANFYRFLSYVSIITEKKFRKGPNKIIQIPSVPSIPLTFTNVMC